jgi:hypothetical protein
MKRFAFLISSLVVLAVGLTGCQAVVSTTITLNGDDVKGSFEVSLVNEAADAVLNDPSADQKLLAALTKRSGTLVERKVGDRVVIYRSGLPGDNSLVPVSGVGISGVAETAEGRRVDLRFTLPSELAEAIRSATEEEPDADARRIVMERSTSICAKVRFAGSIERVESSGDLTLERDRNNVTACTTLERLTAGDGTLQVTGDPNRSLFAPGLLALSTLLLVLLVYRRRLRR